MIVTRLQRRRRAAVAKIAVAITLAVILLTPRLDVGNGSAAGSKVSVDRPIVFSNLGISS